MREALAGGARWAGRAFVCLSGGGNVAVVMGDVRLGGKNLKQSCCACLQCMALGGVTTDQQAGCVGAGGNRCPGGHPRKLCGGAAWPAGVLGQGGLPLLLEERKEGIARIHRGAALTAQAIAA